MKQDDLFLTPPRHDPGGKSKPRWPEDSVVTARFSPGEQLYRYELEEIWDSSKPLAMWLMMNPSVAGIEHADPTLIKTGKYSRAWGYGGQLIGNVHAYRVTNSDKLIEAADPVGPENDAAILAMAKRASLILLAYGQPPEPLRPRGILVVSMLLQAGHFMHRLVLNKDGSPRHPLYLAPNLEPTPFDGLPVTTSAAA